jgi:hypothetical protein
VEKPKQLKKTAGKQRLSAITATPQSAVAIELAEVFERHPDPRAVLAQRGT